MLINGLGALFATDMFMESVSFEISPSLLALVNLWELLF